MNDTYFENWIIQTAVTLDDISPIIKLIGIKTVDDDHLKLAEYLVETNRLLLEFEKNETNLYLLEKQTTLLKQLYEYAAAHFLREEKIIEKYSLDCETEQKEQHSIILQKINEIIVNIEKGSISVNAEIKSFLLEWLLDHIQSYDYNGLNIDNWKKHIISSTNLKDIYPLYKKSDMNAIDKKTKEMIDGTIKNLTLFQKNKINKEDLLTELERKLNLNLSFIENFIQKFNLPGLSSLLEYKVNFFSFIEGLRKKELTLENLKFIVLKKLFKLISIEIYDLVNAGKHMEFVLLNSKDENEISCFIKQTEYDIINKDHSGFIKLVVNANKQMEESTKEEQQSLLINMTNSLIEYAKKHFKNEEKLMDENKNLPAIYEHKVRHSEIIENLNIMKYYLANKKVEVSTILRSKILNMWINHTNSLDQTTFNS